MVNPDFVRMLIVARIFYQGGVPVRNVHSKSTARFVMAVSILRAEVFPRVRSNLGLY